MGTNKDAKDTKRAAMLLADAMDRLQALFIETTQARLGSGPPIDYDEWDRRKQEALARREIAGDIANQLESRVPQGVIDQPKFRRSPTYLFYVASRRGLAKQFSAVDIMNISTMLLWVAEDEDEAEGRQVFREPGPLSEELAARQGAGGLNRSAIHLAGYVALEHADDLALGATLLHSALHVGLGFGI